MRPLRTHDFRHRDFRRRLDLVAKGAGKYAQGFTPKAGAVLVFKPNGVMDKGHVAVVSQVLTDRVIQVTQANWSIIQGRRGQVERDVTVIDVSPQGDWSQSRSGTIRSATSARPSIRPTASSIRPPRPPPPAPPRPRSHRGPDRDEPIGRRRTDARCEPGPDPHQAAGSSTDRIAALLQAATSSDGR